MSLTPRVRATVVLTIITLPADAMLDESGAPFRDNSGALMEGESASMQDNSLNSIQDESFNPMETI